MGWPEGVSAQGGCALGPEPFSNKKAHSGLFVYRSTGGWPEGVEPSIADPQSAVLPLNYGHLSVLLILCTDGNSILQNFVFVYLPSLSNALNISNGTAKITVLD